MARASKRTYADAVVSQLDKLTSGESAFLDGNNKEVVAKKMLEYAKAKDTKELMRAHFYRMYKGLVGYKRAVQNLPVPGLARVMGATIAGRLELKATSKKYRRMQQLSRKVAKIAAYEQGVPEQLYALMCEETGQKPSEKTEQAEDVEDKEDEEDQEEDDAEEQEENSPAPGQEEEDDDDYNEDELEGEAWAKKVAEKRKESEETKRIEKVPKGLLAKKVVQVEKSILKKRKVDEDEENEEDDDQSPEEEEEEDDEPQAEKDVVIELTEENESRKEKKKKAAKQRKEADRKVKFDLSRNTTKSMRLSIEHA